MLNTANIYIDLLNKIKESGGAVPPELVEEVEALDATVNGDETTEPPTVGLVDIVGDLGDEVEDLDIDINGDSTTEPPTPGLKDRVAALEDYGTINDGFETISSYDLSSPYTAPTDGYVRCDSGAVGVDGSTPLMIIKNSVSGDSTTAFIRKGTKIFVGGTSPTVHFIKLKKEE